MKIFLDECVDRRLASHLAGHEIKTARQMGWTTIKNGELLKLAAAQFDVFVTVDRNLSFQQNIANHAISVFVLSAKSNRLADLLPIAPILLSQLDAAQPGVVTMVSAP